MPTQSAAKNRQHALLLLPHVSAAARALSEQETRVLGDLCSSLKEVAETSSTEQGRQALREYLGEQVAEDIEAFWSEEWVCD